jgi:hypothetical protein
MGGFAKGIMGAIAKAKAARAPEGDTKPRGEMSPRPEPQLEPMQCPKCFWRFTADAYGDPGPVCCDFCAHITCPQCHFVFFRALPEHADKPMSFFAEHRRRHALADH